MDKTFIENIVEAFYKVLDFTLISTKQKEINIGDIVVIFLYFFAAWFVLMLFKVVVERTIKRKWGKETQNELNRFYSLHQIVKYFVYFFTISSLLKYFGTDITVILAGSTALLVGVGLGMQNLFNDFVSGILILFDRTLLVNDILEIDGVIGRVERVGMRTTTVKTREDKTMIIPNHYFMSEKLVNWTQTELDTRFNLSVGVAYGTDTLLVKELLIKVAEKHDKVLENPNPQVFFQDFGESSLNFDLVFYLDDVFRIQKIKSDLRFAIDEIFRENNVTIPFPQRDIHVIKNK
ncbi:MAG: mechanosensitive ion channel domain-containing protein [Bacteroidota bacterium]